MSSECASSPLIIAIDLGARNCRLAVYNNGAIEVLPNVDEKRYVLSVVAVKRGRRLVGSPALNTVPSNIIYDACQVTRRSLSRRMEGDEDSLRWHASCTGGKYLTKDANQEHTLHRQEVIAMVLDHLKGVAEKHLSSNNIDKVVICLPSFADDFYRSMVLEAAKIAGFKHIRLLNQTTACAMTFCKENAALFNGSTNRNTRSRTAMISNFKFAVLNIGARTTEASVFGVNALDGKVELVSTSGSACFGGEDFTRCLMNVVLRYMRGDQKADETMLANKKYLKIIRDACEKAKLDLSNFSETAIFIDIFGAEFNYDKFTRPYFEGHSSSAFAQVEDIIDQAFSTFANDITHLLLVGGASRMPKIKEIASKYVSSDCNFVTGIVAEEAAVNGAAVKASVLGNHKSLAYAHLDDFAYKSIFAKANGMTIKLVDRYSSLPTSRTGQPIIRIESGKMISLELYEDATGTFRYLNLVSNASVWTNLDDDGIFFINFLQHDPIYTIYAELFGSHDREGFEQAKEKICQHREGVVPLPSTSANVAALVNSPKEPENMSASKAVQREEKGNAEKEMRLEEREKQAEIERVLRQEKLDVEATQLAAKRDRFKHVTVRKTEQRTASNTPSREKENETVGNDHVGTSTNGELGDADFVLVDEVECVEEKEETCRRPPTPMKGPHKAIDDYILDLDEADEPNNAQTIMKQDCERKNYASQGLRIRQIVNEKTTKLSPYEKLGLTNKCCNIYSDPMRNNNEHLDILFRECVEEAERLLLLDAFLVAVEHIEDFVRNNSIMKDPLTISMPVHTMKNQIIEAVEKRRIPTKDQRRIEKQDLIDLFDKYVEKIRKVIPTGHPLRIDKTLLSMFKLSVVMLNVEKSMESSL